MGRLYPLFFLSGAAGLVYQVVWSRLFHEVFGFTVYAVTTVLATFLAGLALGGVVLGRVADRRASPLRFYGWLEIGIALTALLGLVTLRALEPLHLWAANRLAPDSAALVAVRALLASLVILPPTFLMGGTLPAMTRVFVARLDRLGRELSLLYALNTLGAVAGSLAAGFALIRIVGLHATLWLAVGVNGVVGLASLWLAGALPALRGERAQQPAASEGPTAQPDAHSVQPAGTRAGADLLLVMGLSGFVTLGLEILWTRTLVMIIGTTTYAFVTTLSSFLLGIALGAFVAGQVVDRAASLRRAFGWIQVGIAASTLATLPFIGSGMAQHWLTGWGGEWVRLVALRFGVSFLIMLVPAFLIGTTFPLAAKIWTRDLNRLGRDLGEVYGANTLGNILGAVVTGFVLLPAFGLQRGIVLAASLSLANAAWGFFTASGEGRAARLKPVPLAAGVVVCISLLLFWTPEPLPVWDEQPGDETVYYREGVVATVKVLRTADAPDLLRMTVDGIKIGQNLGGVDAKQQALAHFPFLLLPEDPPRRLLSIGLGTGILAGEVVRHPGVEAMDALENSPSVIEAAREFERFNNGALDHPKIRVIADDGVNFLRRTDATYDAIISDAKSRTKHAANATFFSEEYYRLCRGHLDPRGLMIQWLPLDIPPGELRTILRTFRGVFPNLHVLVRAPGSGFLVGTEGPLVLDVEHIDRLLADPATEGLRRHGMRDPYRFLSYLTADGASLEAWLSDATTINTLEHPVLEFYSPRDHAAPPRRRNDENLLGLLASWIGGSGDGHRIVGGDPSVLAAWDSAARKLTDGALGVEATAPTAELLSLVVPAIREARGHAVLGYTAAVILRRAIEKVPGDADLHFALGTLLLESLRLPGRAVAHYRRAAELRPDDESLRLNLGLALKQAQRPREALEHLNEALRLGPDNPVILTATAEIYATDPDASRRDLTEAVSRAERAAELTGRRSPDVLSTLAAVQASAGDFESAVATGRTALDLATAAGEAPLADEIRRRLALFREQRLLGAGGRSRTRKE